MNSMSASEARDKLYRLLDETANHHEPLLITGPRSNAVLVGEEDWNAIQQTLHLLSVPGVRESIQAGLKTPPAECSDEPGLVNFSGGASPVVRAIKWHDTPARKRGFSATFPFA